MRFIIVGAGAVGSVIGTLLERAGHSICYWRRASHVGALTVQRVGGSRVRSSVPRWASESSPSDWILVCVRTEQLTAALREVVLQLGAARAVAIATVTLDGALCRARAAGLTGPVLGLNVAFGAGIAHDRLEWFPFSVPTTVTCERQPQLRAQARALAQALDAAGLPARSWSGLADSMRLLVATSCALLPSWEQCAWDIGRLARHAALRDTTARGLREAADLVAPPRGFLRQLLLRMPLAISRALIRVLPIAMGTRASELWRQHGPKVREQTGFLLSELLTRARAEQRAVPALSELYAIWESASDGVVETASQRTSAAP